MVKIACWILVLIHCCSVQSWLWSNEVTCSFYGESYTFKKDAPFNYMPLPDCFIPTFTLYTAQTTEGVAISPTNIPSSFDPSKRTFFQSYGYNSYIDPENPEQHWMIKMKNALLDEGDYNVILNDWSCCNSGINYEQYASNTRVAGRAVYHLFKALYNAGLSPSNAHAIGHSLGAQICAFAGQFLGSQKFGRISGLDPAGPEFRGLAENGRLSKGDATFVDVIHTDAGEDYLYDYGMFEPCGHVDFYPNGGQFQPGCTFNREMHSASNFEEGVAKKLESLAKQLRSGNRHARSVDHEKLLEELLEYMEEYKAKEKRQKTVQESRAKKHHQREVLAKLYELEEKINPEKKGAIGCSHGKAIDYYIDSIPSNAGCPATKTCPSSGYENIPTGCSSCSNCPTMGYHASSANPGVYYLTTNEDRPYC